jgi:hypothetical protein
MQRCRKILYLVEDAVAAELWCSQGALLLLDLVGRRRHGRESTSARASSRGQQKRCTVAAQTIMAGRPGPSCG